MEFWYILVWNLEEKLLRFAILPFRFPSPPLSRLFNLPPHSNPYSLTSLEGGAPASDTETPAGENGIQAASPTNGDTYLRPFMADPVQVSWKQNSMRFASGIEIEISWMEILKNF